MKNKINGNIYSITHMIMKIDFPLCLKAAIIAILIIYSSHVIHSQPSIQWQNTIGGSANDGLTSLTSLSDGGFIAIGASESNISGDKTEDSQGDYDYWIVKLDDSGNIVWQNTIGGSGTDVIQSIQETDDGSLVCTGYSNSNISGDKTENAIGGYDYWILKLDASGNVIWQNTIGGDGNDVAYTIEQTTDGGYICGGQSISDASGDKTENSNGDNDYWVIKLDENGQIEWQNTIGGDNDDRLFATHQTTDGGYICAGNSMSNASGDKSENNIGFMDYWVVKLDASGNIQWENTIGGDDDERLYSIQQTTDGGYICGGGSPSNISGDKTENSNGQMDYWVVKLNTSGTIEWQNTIGGSDWDNLIYVQPTSDGGYICGGESSSNISGDKTENSKGQKDYWAIKLNNTGEIVWQKTLGGSLDDIIYTIEQTPGNGYIIGGYSDSNTSGDKTEDSNGADDFWIVKISGDSNLVWPGDANFDGVANNFDLFPIGIGFGSSGPIRTDATTNWEAQPANDWSGIYNNGQNYKHADCNGDGIIDEFDRQAILNNYSAMHNKGNTEVDVDVTDPEIYFDMSLPGLDTASVSQALSIPIQLGSFDTPVNDVYGIAFTIHYDASLIDTSQLNINFATSWLGTEDNDMITLQKNFGTDGEVHVSMVRTDQSNIVSNYGQIATLDIVVADDLAGKTNAEYAELPLSFSNALITSVTEDELAINTTEASLIISSDPSSVHNLKNQRDISVYPNPSKGCINIQNQSSYNQLTIMITDQFGRNILMDDLQDTHTKIDLSHLNNGFYHIKITDKSGTILNTQTISILK